MSAHVTPPTPGPRGPGLPDWLPSAGPLLVGERLNAQGSRRCRRLLLDEDYNGLIAVAREQLERGAHALDVCVTLEQGSGIGDQGSDANGDQGSGVGNQRSGRLADRRDETGRMLALVTRLADAVSVPLFIDSADPAVLQAAVPCIGGRGVANSVTLASGHRDLEALVPIMRAHAARLVVLCIDEEGMAVSAARKLEIVRRLRQLTERLHLEAESLLIDPLTFPVAVGPSERRRAAGESLAAIRQIKDAWPEVQTILGISDVSFGLPASVRPILNAVFLHHAVDAGLDIAIANVITRREYHDLSSEERELADDLLFDRRPDALERLIIKFG